MQLVAYGAQDVYLTGNPQITFFKVVYRRHTNFAMESMQQTITGNNALGGRGVCKLSRNGDLVGSCYVQTTASHSADEQNNRLGFNILKNVELRIGGQKIDKHSKTWMLVWTNLTSTINQSLLLDSMVGGSMSLKDNTLKGAPVTGTGTSLTIPLQFSFCRNPGLALPLIALQYHDVEIVIDYSSQAECRNKGAENTVSISNTSLWVDYIFLDTEERKNFAQKPHEYLIETVQEQVHGVTASTSNSVRLDFNHPVKELIWVGRPTAVTNGDTFANFTNDSALGNGTGLTSTVLKLNGQERFTSMDTKSSVDNSSKYFNNVQNYSYHTGTPLKGVNTYSFALKPEEHQPSGTCNFSRIDNATLNVTTPDKMTELTVMAHSYNVLRVASGMGGLAYSD